MLKILRRRRWWCQFNIKRTKGVLWLENGNFPNNKYGKLHPRAETSGSQNCWKDWGHCWKRSGVTRPPPPPMAFSTKNDLGNHHHHSRKSRSFVSVSVNAIRSVTASTSVFSNAKVMFLTYSQAHLLAISNCTAWPPCYIRSRSENFRERERNSAYSSISEERYSRSLHSLLTKGN